jgi:hypothetical protein
LLALHPSAARGRAGFTKSGAFLGLDVKRLQICGCFGRRWSRSADQARFATARPRGVRCCSADWKGAEGLQCAGKPRLSFA